MSCGFRIDGCLLIIVDANWNGPDPVMAVVQIRPQDDYASTDQELHRLAYARFAEDVSGKLTLKVSVKLKNHMLANKLIKMLIEVAIPLTIESA